MTGSSDKSWSKHSARLTTPDGTTYFFDVNDGQEGLRLVVTQSYPSGERRRVQVPAAQVGPFVSHLLQAVSTMAGPQEPPKQHPPTYLDAVRSRHPNAYKPWTPADDAYLLRERAKGRGVVAIAKDMKRQEGAVRSRIQKLAAPAGSQP